MATPSVCPPPAKTQARAGFFAPAAVLVVDSIVDVYLLAAEQEHVGKARVVRTEWPGTQYPGYGFKFTEIIDAWVLQ